VVTRGLRRVLSRGVVRAVIGMALATCGTLAMVFYPPTPHPVAFPGGKRFAFSIVDDTDMATLARVRPLYDVMARYGLRTTKTVWVLESRSSHEPDHGDTLRNSEYRRFIEELQAKGFEIALHGVKGGGSVRAEIISGLEEFKAILGAYPRMHINHSLNSDNLYWGGARWSFGPFAWLYDRTSQHAFEGQVPGSRHFWGDLARQHIQYVNQFTYRDINLLGVNPSFPSWLEDKPYVNYWFPTSDGDNLDRFEALLSPENLDRLEREGGVCLVYTHLGAGSFNQGDGVNPRFEARIRDVASRNGWFAPASDVLDHLRTQPGWTKDLSFRQRVRLEAKFLAGRTLRSVLPPPVAKRRPVA
jgi:hypothetical protein